jgi:hypothetical protein
MPLEALIFDVDGTLAETEELHRLAFNETFSAFGLDWSWSPELYGKLLRITGGQERIRHYVDTWSPRGGAIALAHLGEIHADKSKRYAELVETCLAEPRPGVRRLIFEAHEQGLRLAIATTTSRAMSPPCFALFLTRKRRLGSRRSQRAISCGAKNRRQIFINTPYASLAATPLAASHLKTPRTASPPRLGRAWQS